MIRWRAVVAVVLGSGYLVSGAQREGPEDESYRAEITSVDCSFLQNPNEFTYDGERVRARRSNETQKVSV
jgi:hypothetical protein